MPLIHSKSKKALGENIAIERKHGKSEKQSIAIAFSEQRRAKSHAKSRALKRMKK